MQFSMKWVLLGMAYVAVAAAAFSQGDWVYADLLWAATFLAVCSALLTTALSRGARRAGATGFALFALALAMCAQFADGTVPTRRILLAAGVQEYPMYAPQVLISSTATVASSPWYPGDNPYSNSAPLPATSVQVARPAAFAPAPFAPVVEPPFASKLRAANAVGAMLMGLVGGWLAVAAFRRQRTVAESHAL